MKGLDRIVTPLVYSPLNQDSSSCGVGPVEEWRVLDVETGGTSETRNAYDTEGF